MGVNACIIRLPTENGSSHNCERWPSVAVPITMQELEPMRTQQGLVGGKGLINNSR